MDENNTKILKSGTQMKQLQQHSNLWITLQLHAAYSGSICLRHTFHHLAATKVTNSVEEVFVIPI
jgi:hypothetical protein